MNSSGKKKSSYQLLLLIILLLVVCVLTWWVSKKDIAAKVNSFFNSRTIPVFYDSTSIEDVKKTLGGYWYRNESKQLPQKPYSISDCVELKDNGIFWEVQQYGLWLPNGDSVNFMHVLTGYINPFKKDPADSNAALVDAFVRAQAYAFSHDTCYVAKEAMDLEKQHDLMKMSQEVYASRIKRTGATLTIDDKAYSAYDTTLYGLASFFPRGSVEIVDQFSAEKCKNNFSLASIVKSELEKYYQSCPLTERDSGDVRMTIQKYYQPLVVAQLASTYTSGVLERMKGQLLVNISIKSDGSVAAATVKKNTVSNKHFPERLKADIMTWRFARSQPSQPVKEVQYEFVF